MTSTQLFMDSQDDFILRMEQEYRASLSPDTTYDFLTDDVATVDLESQGFMVESRVATSLAVEATEAEVASLLIGEQLTSVELAASGIGTLISEGVGGMSLMSGSIALFSASAAVLGAALTAMEISSAMDSTVYHNNLKKKNIRKSTKITSHSGNCQRIPYLVRYLHERCRYHLTAMACN